MGEGRNFWIGELQEKITEHPHETHCLHLETPFKNITFLCNVADFQQLQIICKSVTGEIDSEWMASMIKISRPHKRTFNQCCKKYY